MKLMYSLAAFVAIAIVLSCNKLNKESSPSVTNLEMLKSPAADKVPASGLFKAQNGIEAETYFNADSVAFQQTPGNDQKQQRQPQVPVPKPDWDKKIIKTATLNAEVKDYKSFYAALREKVKSVGGYVAQEELSQSEYKIENTLVIKVPVDQFDNAVSQLSLNTEKINEKKITSQDVTTEVVDTKSRMESKKQVRLRYMDLLKQAKNMQEILSVQSEINGIQEEIESAAGRLEYLGHSSVFSTINMTYYQVLNVSAKDTKSPSFATRVAASFRAGWSWIGEFLVGMVSIWPLFIFVATLILLFKRYRFQKPKQA